jgi:glutamate-5-semialdehyde dehydrogenase
MSVKEIAVRARTAAATIAAASTEQKNQIILAVAAALREKKAEIQAANNKDVQAGKLGGLREALIDRLTLTDKVIESMAVGAEQVAALDDPTQRVIEEFTNADGLLIQKVSVPFGVIGMIFEARPNVAVDSALLCLKSGNAVVLRGGKEAIHSNMALVALIRDVLTAQNFPADCVCLVEDTDRASAQEMMTLKGDLDLLIPRGGKGLIASVVENATVPVIETGTGNCHVFIDESADAEMAQRIILNAKTSRPSVCNAAETMLVHAASPLLPRLCKALDEAGVELRGDARACAAYPMKAATEEDFYTEYNDYILTVGIVDGIEEAIAHINEHGTKHSESIVTENAANAERFLRSIDAAAVYHNASTRFTDGFVFGLGAEIGISTQKLHARGPMGLRELTTYQYRIRGVGQVR